jgi:phage baseplate assembly protein W
MSNNLSDYNKTRSSNVLRQNLYTDLPINFKSVHPNLKDIIALKDLDAVKQSVKNLILTNHGERPFQPDIGSNITGLLFEPADTFTANAIRMEIFAVLKRFEPRVTDITVQVFDNSDRNAYNITIGFRVIFAEGEQEVNFYLQRLR